MWAGVKEEAENGDVEGEFRLPSHTILFAGVVVVDISTK